MYRAIVIGANPAGISARHAQVLQRIPEVRIAAVVDINMDRARQFAQHQGWTAPVCPSLAEAIGQLQEQNQPADYAMLFTPREVREPIIACCVEQNFPLLMEKPPCHCLSVGQKVASALASSGLLHSVAFPHRYNEALNHVLKRLEGQALTQVNTCVQAPMATCPPAKGTVSLPHLWERSGGLVGDQGIHYIDLARYVSGSEIRRVIGAHGAFLRGAATAELTSVDSAGWLLEMESGLLVQHSHSWLTPHWYAGIELITRESAVRVSLYDNTAAGVIQGKSFSFTGRGDWYEFELEHRAFVTALERKSMEPIRSSYADALRSFEIAARINTQFYPHCMELS